MWQTKLMTTATGFALAWGGVAVAQQAGQVQPGRQDQQQLQRQQDQQTQQQRMQARGDTEHGQLKLKRGDRIIGANVVDRQNEDLGEVQDLAIDRSSGHVAFAIVQFTDVEGVERNKRFPVPLTALKAEGERTMQQEQERREAAQDRLQAGRDDDTWFVDQPATQTKLVLDLPRERLRNAPSYDQDQTPNLTDRNYVQQVYQFYGQRSYHDTAGKQREGQLGTGQQQGQAGIGATGQQQGQTGVTGQQQGQAGATGQQQGQTVAGRHDQKQGKALLADEHLMGENITRNDENIGELKNLIVDHQKCKVAFVIVEMSEVDGDRNLAALPWNQLEFQRADDADDLTITLKTDVNRIRGQMFSDREWPNLANRQFASNIYRQFGERPYWETGTDDVLGFQD